MESGTNRGDFKVPIAAEVEKTWNKVERECKKHGFRDGAADGRDKMFQKSFDEGYFEGLKSGFALGKYKGYIRALQERDKIIQGEQADLNNTRRGACRMCSNPQLLERSTDEIKLEQHERSCTILKKLYAKFGRDASITLPDAVD